MDGRFYTATAGLTWLLQQLNETVAATKRHHEKLVSDNLVGLEVTLQAHALTERVSQLERFARQLYDSPTLDLQHSPCRAPLVGDVLRARRDNSVHGVGIEVKKGDLFVVDEVYSNDELNDSGVLCSLLSIQRNETLDEWSNILTIGAPSSEYYEISIDDFELVEEPGEQFDLLPCPFCGDTAQVLADTKINIVCQSCGTEGPTTKNARVCAPMAFALWNRRKTS